MAFVRLIIINSNITPFQISKIPFQITKALLNRDLKLLSIISDIIFL